MVLFPVGEKYEGLQKRLSRKEVAALLEAELIHVVYLQMGTFGSRSVNPKVHELDCSPHGSELLLIEERTEIYLFCSKVAEEVLDWHSFIIFSLPRKVRAEWNKLTSLG